MQTFVAPDDEVLAPALLVRLLRAGARAHRRPFRESAGRARLRLRRRRAAGRGHAAHQAGVPRQSEQSDRRVPRPRGARPSWCGGCRRDVVLAVDEAYFEYARAADYPDARRCSASASGWSSLRTFSKIYGLAGAARRLRDRAAEIVDCARTACGCRSTSRRSAQAAARAALDDGEHVERSQRLNARELARLAAALRALGLARACRRRRTSCWSASARATAALYERLLARGVIVRPMAATGCRTTCASPSAPRRRTGGCSRRCGPCCEALSARRARRLRA